MRIRTEGEDQAHGAIARAYLLAVEAENFLDDAIREAEKQVSSGEVMPDTLLVLQNLRGAQHGVIAMMMHNSPGFMEKLPEVRAAKTAAV